MAAGESAVIVPVPETEPAVRSLRAQLDRAAAGGVPAHLTVLYPFLPPDQIGPPELRRLSKAVRTVPRFDVAFRRVEWFGDDVVWLAPEPSDRFRDLTAAVWSAFPDWPPYGGAYAEVVPHLTVAAHADLDRMRAAARATTARLPITAGVHTVHLFQGSDAPGAWHSVAELPLG
ncbi:MAG: 2'-5' RNA ligase family protein [Pseudonocardiaceae bacterium]